MTRQELQHYRDTLTALAARLSGDVAHLESEVRRPVGAESEDLSTGSAGQEADRPVRGAEEDVSLSLLGKEGEILAEVRGALARFDAGKYGVCESCEQPIAKARLDTLPYVRRCIRCARQTDGAE